MLTVLLETFRFEAGSNEIQWNMTSLATPTVKGSTDITPQLPLKLTFLKA